MNFKESSSSSTTTASSSSASASSAAAMSAFVLLWGGGAIVTRVALDHGSVSAVLLLRYALALGALLLLCPRGGRRLPEPGTRWRVAGAGLPLIAGYSVFYFQAMERGITPGLLATMLGVQPILTLLLTERGAYSPARLAGLLLALGGLALVVGQSLLRTRLSAAGLACALAALLCSTGGAPLQKRIPQPPAQVLPLQYGVTLLVYTALLPLQPFHFQLSAGFLLPTLFLGLVISVGAQLLCYRLIQRGNLVNVTSLFYLVPAVTVLLDFLILGNALSAPALAGMAGILAGLALVLRSGRRNTTAPLQAAADS